jgi:hypothetical protein
MNSVDQFIEHVEHVCKRPHLHVAGGSFGEICAYFTGYAAGAKDCPLSGEGWRAFNTFVCATFGFPQKLVWPYVLKTSSRDDAEATARLKHLLLDFADRCRRQSAQEIAHDAMTRARRRAESEPVKVWRRFSRAIHRGDRKEVESVIQDHPDAEVLWSATNPDDVAQALDCIAESYLVNEIAGSEEEGEVVIITPDFGPIGVKRVGNDWRIDASKIINCWKANRAGKQEPPAN